jgi:hypothetical protein
MMVSGAGARVPAAVWVVLIAASLLILVLALAGSASSQTRPALLLASRQITTVVLNGTHRPGLASRVSRMLASFGIATRRLHQGWVANAPQLTRLTTIYVDPRQSDASAAARRLRHLFGRGIRVESMPPQIRRYADRAGRPLTVIVIGSSFRGLP